MASKLLAKQLSTDIACRLLDKLDKFDKFAGTPKPFDTTPSVDVVLGYYEKTIPDIGYNL